MLIERRTFLETACKACLLAGAGFLMSDLAACSPASGVMKLSVTNDSVRLPVAVFAKETMQIVRPQGWFFDIAVRKISAGQYEALLLECTHQQNQLMVNPNGFRCALHGSQFNLDGQVVKGPAESALKKYATKIDQDQLIIELKS